MKIPDAISSEVTSKHRMIKYTNEFPYRILVYIRLVYKSKGKTNGLTENMLCCFSVGGAECGKLSENYCIMVWLTYSMLIEDMLSYIGNVNFL